MIFKSLKIFEGLLQREIVFGETITQIHSKQNSVGKTTLIRMLLYSLGYSIPSTQGISFRKCKFVLKLKIDRFEVILTREDDSIKYKENENVTDFILPYEQDLLHTKLLGIENLDILHNVLGSIYFDQDKGWTLLNRGKIIGNNKFNIETLILGLGDLEYQDLMDKQNILVRELAKYKNMYNVGKYQQEVLEYKENLTFDTHEEEIIKELSIINFEIKQLNEKIKEVDKLSKSNINFVNYIENLGICVQSSQGELVPVNKETIINYNDDVEYLNAKKKMMKIEYYKYLDKKNTLESSVNNEVKLVETETIINSFDKDIMRLDIDNVVVERVIKKLEKEKKVINDQINKVTRSNTRTITNLYNNVKKYSVELGVDKYINDAKDFIFTSDLKRYSGTILHKLVFVFKLSYVLELEKKLGYKLPIIIDSPSGREVNQENISKMMSILRRDFSENQLIIASIFDYEFPNKENIEIQNRLFEL
ncbi:MAG: hypothetical protein N4A40_03000 [Tissierellales bacterium]|jgi:hypothetical protein|nr:hypothetical protein [Tissierellales bacterium]